MRLLHTMIRVGDLNRSIDFYTNVLGMKLLRQKEYPDGQFTLAFIGFGDETDHTVIELTYDCLLWIGVGDLTVSAISRPGSFCGWIVCAFLTIHQMAA